MKGDWTLIPIKFPAALRAALESYLDEPVPVVKVAAPLRTAS